MNRVSRDVGSLTGGAGVVVAACGALCCAGAPILVSVLAATGLSFLRNDSILWPLIAIALIVALWGFWKSRARHQNTGPLFMASIGAIALVLGVVVLHGLIARWAIGIGAVVLLVATVWNARLAASCDEPVQLHRNLK